MNAADLEALYQKYNRRRYVRPDPLECVYDYPETKDREIAAFAAAALAYGQVGQIVKSVRMVLDKMGPSPRRYLENAGIEDLYADFDGFVHRFATGRHVAAMLAGLKGLVERYGSLEQAFAQGAGPDDLTYAPALGAFVSEMARHWPENPGHLVAVPEKGSACKRLFLFLRWMVRCDAVDPGGWDQMRPAKLVIPLDIHMYRACCQMGLTDRRQASLKTALDITAGFAQLVPHDPVRYDFVLTRPGIRGPW
ncbi:MAG: TIGR02757 family protein [Desulfobacteraceae bacterium]|nr:TIGR02757 family protein [Desulfobacteraceae bacterium]